MYGLLAGLVGAGEDSFLGLDCRRTQLIQLTSRAGELDFVHHVLPAVVDLLRVSCSAGIADPYDFDHY